MPLYRVSKNPNFPTILLVNVDRVQRLLLKWLLNLLDTMYEIKGWRLLVRDVREKKDFLEPKRASAALLPASFA